MNQEQDERAHIIHLPSTEILRRTTPLARRGLHIVNDMRFQQKDLSSSVITAINPIDGAEMVWVPAGNFLMGTSEEEVEMLIKYPDWYDNWDKEKLFCAEYPQHTVYLDGFWIYKYEVTVAQYKTFCLTTGYVFDWKFDESDGLDRQDNQPISGVTWFDAKAYADWAGVSLPTEAQWEKAARGIGGNIFPWGNVWDGEKCHNSVGREKSHNTPSHIDSYPEGASPYGCLDMVGNVYEWCGDWYDANYYKYSPSHNPIGPADGEDRVIRSVSYVDCFISVFHCASRSGAQPSFRLDVFGFRCAIS